MVEPSDSKLRRRFLSAMSRAASTVNVVTTAGSAGRAGVTVSSMAPVSADSRNPTLLVCVHELSPAANNILENKVFCVNVLRDDQSYIADSFAGRFKDTVSDKFECAEWIEEKSGSPRLLNPLVAFDCIVSGVSIVGTHHVIIGEVNGIYISGTGSPLIYARRAYGTATRIDSVESISSGIALEGRDLRIGCFHTFGPFVLPGILERLGTRQSGQVKLVEGDHRRVVESLRSGETDLGLLFDFDLDEGVEVELLAELDPYVLLAEDSKLAEFSVLKLEQLAPRAMVLLDAPPSSEYFRSLFLNAGLEPSVAYTSGSLEMVRGMVARGLGYSLLTTRPAANLAYDGNRLTTRPLFDRVRPSRVVLARRKGAEDTGIVAAFAELCREFFDDGAAQPRNFRNETQEN